MMPEMFDSLVGRRLASAQIQRRTARRARLFCTVGSRAARRCTSGGRHREALRMPHVQARRRSRSSPAARRAGGAEPRATDAATAAGAKPRRALLQGHRARSRSHRPSDTARPGSAPTSTCRPSAAGPTTRTRPETRRASSQSRVRKRCADMRQRQGERHRLSPLPLADQVLDVTEVALEHLRAAMTHACADRHRSAFAASFMRTFDGHEHPLLRRGQVHARVVVPVFCARRLQAILTQRCRQCQSGPAIDIGPQLVQPPQCGIEAC